MRRQARDGVQQLQTHALDDDVVALAKNSLSRFSQENTGDMRGREGLSPDRNCDGVINSLLPSFDAPKQTDAMGSSEEKVWMSGKMSGETVELRKSTRCTLH